jgi:outer membrane protein assembly factor BamB
LLFYSFSYTVWKSTPTATKGEFMHVPVLLFMLLHAPAASAVAEPPACNDQANADVAESPDTLTDEGDLSPEAVAAPDCSWSQWGRTSSHGSQGCWPAQNPQRELARVTLDPFVAQETAEDFGDLPVHFQVPLLDAQGNVFVMQKKGRYVSCNPAGSGRPAPCGPAAWSTMIWSEHALAWKNGALVDSWTFVSDWKPAPANFTDVAFSSDEPIFQPTLSGPFLYVAGAGGSAFKLNRLTGKVVRRITPFGPRTNPNTYIVGGLTADGRGNVYYNVLLLDPARPWTADARGFLVHLDSSDRATRVDYGSLVPRAPRPNSPCYLEFRFGNIPQPWPPPNQPGGAPTLPPQIACLSQRPALNATPAVGPDGTIFVVSRAHAAFGYAYIVAVAPTLRPKWAVSLRGQLHDGCGVLADCPAGAAHGVDPNTNLPPAGGAYDDSSSTPVALPDGGVVYAAETLYNGGRGHLMKFDSHGNFGGSYDFGWDSTPGLYVHDGTYSFVIKDNHYNNNEGPFYVTQLNARLGIEWQFVSTNTKTCQRAGDGSISCVDDGTHPNGFEWCISAPAIDSDGTVYVTSEDGFFYAITQGGTEKAHLFLSQAIGSAYTPVAIDMAGRIYAINSGEMSVLGSD